jgi:uncharacterized protein YccT (UPF0319 family)
MDETDLIELVRNMPPLWDQRDKNDHKKDLKPKLWEEIGEKLTLQVSTEIITAMNYSSNYLYV